MLDLFGTDVDDRIYDRTGQYTVFFDRMAMLPHYAPAGLTRDETLTSAADYLHDQIGGLWCREISGGTPQPIHLVPDDDDPFRGSVYYGTSHRGRWHAWHHRDLGDNTLPSHMRPWT